MRDPGVFSPRLGPASSILPWSIGAWKRDLRITGFAGMALLSLQVAEFGRAEPDMAHKVHESLRSLLVFRAPFTLAACLFLLVNPQFRKIKLGDLSGWFLLYVLYFVASSIWSTDPVMTFGKGFELLIGLAIVLRLSCREDSLYKLDALRTLLLRVIATVGTLAVAGFLLRLPAFVSHRHGILLNSTADTPFLSSNGLGYISSLLLLCVSGDCISGRISKKSACMQSGYAIFLFLFAASRTSVLIVVFGMGILLIVKSWILGLGYFISLVAAVFLKLAAILKVFQGRQPQPGFRTLSGRTVLWAAAWKQWKAHPFWGFGGGAGGKFVIAHLGVPRLQVVSSLHNGFLEALTGLGAVGFMVVLSLLIMTTLSTCRRLRREREMLGIYILIPHIWITSIMSIGALAWMNYEVMFYLILISVLDIRRRDDRQAGELPCAKQTGSWFELAPDRKASLPTAQPSGETMQL